MDIEVMGDKVSLRLEGDYTAQELLELMQRLGQARAQITQDPPTPVGLKIDATVNPPYWAEFIGEIGCSGVFMRHPGFGWLGFALPPVEAGRLANYLHAQVVNVLAATTTAAQGAAALPANNDGSKGGGLLH